MKKEVGNLSKARPPLWGNFVGYADYDLLAFGALAHSGLFVQASYHVTQAMEKYLKSLILSISDPKGTSATPQNSKFDLKTHDLSKLAIECGNSYPYYVKTETQELFKRFEEFDQAARYPWVTQRHGNGFTTADIPIFKEVICHLRNDIPIKVDDYPLGMLVRGHHHNNPDTKADGWYWQSLQPAIQALRDVFGDVDVLVRK